jgi:hypothetical protein
MNKTRIRYADISVQRTKNGYYECSAMIDGRYVSHRYLYYTKREALRRFHDTMNGKGGDR